MTKRQKETEGTVSGWKECQGSPGLGQPRTPSHPSDPIGNYGVIDLGTLPFNRRTAIQHKGW